MKAAWIIFVILLYRATLNTDATAMTKPATPGHKLRKSPTAAFAAVLWACLAFVLAPFLFLPICVEIHHAIGTPAAHTNGRAPALTSREVNPNGKRLKDKVLDPHMGKGNRVLLLACGDAAQRVLRASNAKGLAGTANVPHLSKISDWEGFAWAVVNLLDPFLKAAGRRHVVFDKILTALTMDRYPCHNRSGTYSVKELVQRGYEFDQTDSNAGGKESQRRHGNPATHDDRSAGGKESQRRHGNPATHDDCSYGGKQRNLKHGNPGHLGGRPCEGPSGVTIAGMDSRDYRRLKAKEQQDCKQLIDGLPKIQQFLKKE